MVLGFIKTSRLIFLFLILVSSAYSPKISKHFEHNNYIRNYSVHIINDSLQLYFKSPADINYITESEELKNAIQNAGFKLKDKVLVYGRTNDPPYEYFVTVSKGAKKEYPKKLIVLDTVVGSLNIQFIGKPLAENSRKSLEPDLHNMFSSLEVGATYRKDISTVMDVVKKHQNSNKFLAALKEINEFPAYDKQEEWVKLQMQLTFSSFLGDNTFYKESLKLLESRFKPNNIISKTIKENFLRDSEAINTILKEAEKHKIVMINENHFYPNHRLLVLDLLEELKEIGYTHIAIEALDVKQDSLLNLEGSYPALKTGFYTSEQHFSNLIRKAKHLGYEFVAYENNDANKNREQGQAENLYNKTFKINPESKVLVLAGIDHILEKPSFSGKEWMASIFKNKYKMDPLTMSQTHLNSYRSEIKATYGLISSEILENDKFNSVDYFMLNNKSIADMESASSFLYTNNSPSDVQVVLFYGSEIKHKFDYHNKVPYYTSILKSGMQYQLPIIKNEEIYLYTYDKHGNQIDKKIVKVSDNE